MTSVLVGAPGSGRSAQPGSAQRLIHNPNKEAGCSGTKATSCRRGWEKAGPKESHPPSLDPTWLLLPAPNQESHFLSAARELKIFGFSGQDLLASFLLAISSTARCKFRAFFFFFLENNKIVGAQALKPPSPNKDVNDRLYQGYIAGVAKRRPENKGNLREDQK